MNNIIKFSMVLMAITIFSINALAVVPELIPVQGVLTDADDAVLDGLVDVTFTVYDASTDGTALWSEVYDGTNQLNVEKGFFVAYLGNLTPLDFQSMLAVDELWLGIEVNGDGEMDRILMGSVPFALEAQYCEQVGDFTADDLQPRLNISGNTANGTCTTGQVITAINPSTGAITCSTPPAASMDTVTIVVDGPSISAGSFGSSVMDCPADHPVVVSCGLDLSNVLTMAVTSVAPRISSKRAFQTAAGTYTTQPNGCQVTARNDGTSAASPGFKGVMVCRK